MYQMTSCPACSHTMSSWPSPSKSPVPCICHDGSRTPIDRSDAIVPRFTNHSISVPFAFCHVRVALIAFHGPVPLLETTPSATTSHLPSPSTSPSVTSGRPFVDEFRYLH